MKNKYVNIRLKRFGISFQWNAKALFLTCLLTAVILVLLLLSAGIGSVFIHPVKVAQVLLGNGSERDALIITQLRMPRVMAAMMVGAALAASGTIMQGMFRNPLASPDVLGVTSGASAAAVGFLLLFESASVHWLPFAAFGGAALTSILMYGIAWKRGVSPLTLVLIGVGLGAAMSALTTLFIISSPMYLTDKALNWLAGSVYGTTWRLVFAMLPWFAMFMTLALILTRRINIQQLGDDVAKGAGSFVQLDRLLLLLISGALAGSAVAVGGAIGFVALIAPQIGRKLLGPSIGTLLPAAALIGSVIVMSADIVARTAFSPLDLPVGIFTSIIGAPFFIYLLYKSRNI